MSAQQLFPALENLGTRLAAASAKLESELIAQGALPKEAYDLFAAIVHARVSKAFLSQIQGILEHAAGTSLTTTDEVDMEAETIRAGAAFDWLSAGDVAQEQGAPPARMWSPREAFIQGALHARRMDTLEPTVQDYDNLIRELCCFLSSGGWNSEGIMPIATARSKIYSGITYLTEPLQRQIADLRESLLAANTTAPTGHASLTLHR